MVEIKVTDIPAEMLMRVTRINDIKTARIMSKKEKTMQINANNSRNGMVADVVLNGIDGRKELITRVELLKEFRTSNNKKIRLYKWHNSKKYLVVRFERKPMIAVRVPVKSKTAIGLGDGELAKPGVYLVFDMAADGGIDNSKKPLQVPAKIFKKSFHVDKLYDMNGIRGLFEHGRIKQDMTDLALNDDMGQPVPVSGNSKNMQLKPASNTIKVNINKEPGNNMMASSNKKIVQASYRIKERLINNNSNKLVGFVITNGINEVEVNTAKIMELCGSGKISNATLVTNEGKRFIRGVGVSLSSLPERKYVFYPDGKRSRVY